MTNLRAYHASSNHDRPDFVKMSGGGQFWSDTLGRMVDYYYEDDAIDLDLTDEEKPAWFKVVEELKGG